MPDGAEPGPGGVEPSPGVEPGPGGVQPRPGGVEPRPGGVEPRPGGVEPLPGGVESRPGGVERGSGVEPRPGGVQPHPDLAPLLFLFGRWEGAGVGGYPTIESFQFGQEISFSHNGKPYLFYVSRTWLLDAEGRPIRPLAMETGFWRAQPEGKVEVLLAHPTGITEIYLGEITGTKIEMATDVVARTASAKDVRAGRRLYGMADGDLAYAYDMAAVGQALQPHVSAQLKRVSPAGDSPRPQ